jgi:hypothetical protein
MGLVGQAGGQATFTAAASGAPDPTVRWQVASDRNGPWSDLGGNATETSPALVVTASATNLGDAYRAVFTNASGTAISRPAKLVSRLDWMRDLGNDIADVPLNELTIPGSHDMGTYGIDSDSNVSQDGQLPSAACDVSHAACVSWSRAQDSSETAQEELTEGIRYFDVRVCGKSDDSILDIPEDWPLFTSTTCHGLEGAALDPILQDTRAFVLAHPAEVVILDINHEFQADPNTIASQVDAAFALPDGGSLMIPPQYCIPGNEESGECASDLTLRKIRDGKLGNVIVNFEDDGAPGSATTTETNFDSATGDPVIFNIQPLPTLRFFDRHPRLWGRLDGAPNAMEFCTEGSATSSCFGNNSDVQSVRARVLNTLSTRATFTDTRHLFIQFLQTTPDTTYILENVDRSLFDMATAPDIGSNPIIGPALFDCNPGICFAEVRPENTNIVAINFFNHTDYNVEHPLTIDQALDCMNGGPCTLTPTEQGTVACDLLDCSYTDPVHFDFIDQVIRFDEYARTAPVVAATPASAPASTGWYNAATLGGVGNTLALGVTAQDYYYPLGVTALSCLDGSGALSISPNTPSPNPVAHGSASLADGVHQIACQATDAANQGFHGVGNQGAGPGSQAAATFQIDTHPPTVTYSGDSGSYGILANVAITCTAADTLSGVASTTCANQSGPAYSFGAGTHPLSASATDKAGNTGSGTASFTVTVSAADLDSLTHQFADTTPLYKAAPAFLKVVVDIGVSNSDLALKTIGPRTTAAQKHSVIVSYDQGVQTLARENWLTSSQASTLIGLAAAL